MSAFVGEALMAEIGAALGDVGRVRMLTALMSGRALPAGELAWQARVTPQTASAHLGRLTAAGLVACLRQGRHRYFRIASPEVADLIEALTVTAAAAPAPRFRPRSASDEAMVRARTCYDHLAGRWGVALAESLVAGGHLQWNGDGGLLTPSGARLLGELGIDVTSVVGHRRAFCRPCLDWSERRWHVGGAIGAALLERFLAQDWLRRTRDSRALEVTPAGSAGFLDVLGVEPDADGAASADVSAPLRPRSRSRG